MSEFDEEITAAMEPFLSGRLSELGLDYETYGPYLVPVLTEGDEETRKEEWESVLELLQASSETHSDDEQAWAAFRTDVQGLWDKLMAERSAQQRKQHDKEVEAYNEGLVKEREVARLAEIERQRAVKEKAAREMDDAKRAMIERYAYENDEDDSQADDEGEAVVSNKEAAAQAAREHSRELKKQNVTSKKEEQQKTAKAKLQKAKLKEERRHRAAKGERKR